MSEPAGYNKLPGSIKREFLSINASIGNESEALNTPQKHSCCWGSSHRRQLYLYLMTYLAPNCRQYISQCRFKRRRSCSHHISCNHCRCSGHCRRKNQRQSPGPATKSANGMMSVVNDWCWRRWLLDYIVSGHRSSAVDQWRWRQFLVRKKGNWSWCEKWLRVVPSLSRPIST